MTYTVPMDFDALQAEHDGWFFFFVMFAVVGFTVCLLIGELDTMGYVDSGSMHNACFKAIGVTGSLIFIAAANNFIIPLTMSGRYDYMLLSVVLEEVHKFLFPMALPFSEFVGRLDWDVSIIFSAAIPFAMHTYTQTIPFHFRIVMHALYNFAIYNSQYTHGQLGLATFSLDRYKDLRKEDCEFLMKIYQLLDLLYSDQKKHFCLAVVNFGFAEDLLNFFKGICDDVQAISALFFIGTSGFSLTSSGTRLLQMFNKLLPSFIVQSPSYMAGVTMVSCILGSCVFSNIEEFMSYLPILDFTKLSAGDMVITAMEASLTLFRSVSTAIKSGNFFDFFLNPRLYVLRMKSAEILSREIKTHEEQLLFVDEVDAMMESLARCGDQSLMSLVPRLSEKKNSFKTTVILPELILEVSELISCTPNTIEMYDDTISKLRELLSNGRLAPIPNYIPKVHEAINSLEKNKRACDSRPVPLAIILLGPPGTGKTAIMDQVVDNYAALSGEEIDPAMVGHLVVDQKHPAETVHKDAKVLVLSDTVADHSEDNKSDRMSFGVLLQQALDTTPLVFPSATVSRKGTSLNLVKLLFITTNARTWLMSEETERLQRRMDESAIIIDLSIVENGRVVPETEFRYWSTEKRNEFTCVRMMRVNCMGKAMTIVDPCTDNFVHVSHFFEYFRERTLLKPRRDSLKKEIMSERCPCGILYHTHYRRGAGPDLEFAHLNDLCVPTDRKKLKKLPPLCPCGLETGHVYNPIWDHTKNATAVSRLAESRPRAPTRVHGSGKSGTILEVATPRYVKRKPKDDVFEEETFAYTFGFSDAVFSCAVIVFLWVMVFSTWDRMSRDIHIILDKGELAVDRTLVKVETFKVFINYWSTVEQRARLAAYKSYVRAKHFVKSYGGLLLGATALAALVSMMRKSTMKDTAKIVLRENTDLNSLVVDSFTQEITYEKDLAEKWQKKPETMKMVKLHTIGSSPQDLCGVVEKCVFPIKVTNSSGVCMAGFALVLDASWIMMNRHYLYCKKDGHFMKVVLEFRNMYSHVGECDVEPVVVDGLETDVVLVRNPSPLPCKDIVKFFSDHVGVDQIMTTVMIPGRTYRMNALVMPGLPGRVESQPRFAGKTWSTRLLGKEGECGSPAVAETSSGSYIMGIVSFKIDELPYGKQGGNVVTRSAIFDAMERHCEPMVNSITSNFELSDLTTLSTNSELRNLMTPFIVPMGTRPGNSAKFASDFKETSLKPLIDEKKFLSKPYGIIKQVHGLVGPKGESEFVSAFSQTMKGIKPHGVIDSDVLRRSTNKYVKYVVKGIFEKLGAIRLSPISLADSFFGKSEMDVLRCNFQSSVGPEDRFYKSRNGIFDYDEETKLFMANPAFVEKLQSVLRELKQNVARMPWVCGSYKDEIRSLEKLLEMRVRLFYTVDLYTNQISRMYIQPLIQLLLRFPYLSKCFGKMDSGSAEWDTFYKYVMKGYRQLDLDFANFDISHYFRLIREVAWFFYQLAMVWYAHEESARIVYLLIYSLGCQLFEHKNDFSLKLKGLPSGHIVTLILNSIVNVMLMMVAFEELCPGLDFFEHVFPGTVGDDNLSGVSETVHEKFHLVNLQIIYRRFGYTVTDASKSKDVKPFVDPKDMQFLKRKFRFEKRLNLVVAPLETDSVYKMLAFWTFKKQGGASYTERMSACLDVAQREMFLHGEEVFVKFVTDFEQPCQELGLFVRWYTFEELAVMYLGGEQFMSW
jgi:hypothetical protein